MKLTVLKDTLHKTSILKMARVERWDDQVWQVHLNMSCNRKGDEPYWDKR